MSSILALLAILAFYTFTSYSQTARILLAGLALYRAALYTYRLFCYWLRENDDGWCYLVAFEWHWFALLWLGKYPSGADVEFLFFLCTGGENLHDFWSSLPVNGVYHLIPISQATTFLTNEEWESDDFVYGSLQGGFDAGHRSAHYSTQVNRSYQTAAGHSRGYVRADLHIPSEHVSVEKKISARHVANDVALESRASARELLEISIQEARLAKAVAEASFRHGLSDVAAVEQYGAHTVKRGIAALGSLARAVPPTAKMRRLMHDAATPVWALRKLHGMRSWSPLSEIPLGEAVDAEQVIGVDHFTRMNQVDAMEAVKILNSSTDAVGESERRMANALEVYPKGIATAVPPSHPNFTRLTKLVGPLAHRPRIAGHKEAVTLRRAALAQASRALEGAIVGLISPSTTEIHTFPNAAVWVYDDGQVDKARQAKHCTQCKAPRCELLRVAEEDARVLKSNDLNLAADFFARFDVQSLLLLNIEPNIKATDLLALMTRAGIWNAYSLVSVDWRVLVTGHAEDPLIGMTTRVDGGQVISSFQDAGDYVQPADNVRQLFRPTAVEGHSLRRTVLFGERATWYFELNVASTNVATRCLPDVEKWYFLRIPDPSAVDTVLMAEREGFDRVLGTYRTQAIKDLETAKIVLRQSNVTYSIAGTQVTPRLALTNSEFEALAVWLVVYSEVQDAVAQRTAKSLSKPSTAALLSTSVWGGVKERLTATSGGQMALGTYSAVEEALGAYRRAIQERTIDQLSDAVIVEVFGSKLSTVSTAKSFMTKWASVKKIAEVAWAAKDLIGPTLLRSWRIAFSAADAVVLTTLLGCRLTSDAIAVALDLALSIARVTGHTEAARNIRAYTRYVNWPTTKADVFWCKAQQAQSLDFQAASIDIVETFYNTFASDHAVALESAREAIAQQNQDFGILQAQADLPFSDFLSEVKLFLGRFNTRAEVFTATNKMLKAFRHDKRHASESQKARMVHVLQHHQATVAEVESEKMHFSLGGEPKTMPLPIHIRVINDDDVDVRAAFHESRAIQFRPNPVATTLERLQVIDDVVDFTPIHEEMERLHPGGVVNQQNFGSVTSISPDQRGADLQRALINFGAANMRFAEFCPEDSLEPWWQEQMRSPGMIEPVQKILVSAHGLTTGQHVRKWVAHIDGLAMGGKSAGVRKWITNEDLVVVPTGKLKEEWIESLGKLDPLRRATVVTQHNALVQKYTTGFVIIDEAYTLDPQLLQMIANRHSRSKGLITIGDGHQIGNVFTEGNGLDPTLAPCRMISPVSFCPWDSLCVYLAHNTSPLRGEKYYCGSKSTEGLLYTLNSEETLIPGKGDLAMCGLQASKAVLHMRGLLKAITVHEAQGARSEHTIYHTAGSLDRDVTWLGLPERSKHAGVLVTRARKSTVFVVNALGDLRALDWVAVGVAGELPNTCIYGGTFWDFVDPRVVDDAIETYIHEERIPETTRVDRPLTNPITIGTVFVDGEAVAKSELRAHVALTSGVKLTDLGIAHSDAFDDYLIQPRDVPGVDQIQALTRAVRKPKPNHADFVDAEVIVNRIFDQVIDPKLFFSHLKNTKRCVLNRRERSQVIDGCYADTETRRSTLSFGFLKPEFAKKASELSSQTGGELKAQGVITASAAQQAIFMDACDALTHAWARSMRQGKFSPVGFKEADIDSVLATFERTWELDLEKQDSSHAAVHVLVACRLLEMAADHLGMDTMAKEIREQRTVRMMKDPFTFVLQMALASGDPWTLIFNKIMAVSSLISVAYLGDVRMMQTGDDITMDKEPTWDHRERIKAQKSANRGLTWKVEEREQRKAGVTFISRGALPNRTIVYKALRTVLKYTARRRTRLQHASYASDTKRLLNASASMGLMAYVEARCRVFGGDPAVVHDMWARAIELALTPFEALPAHLRDDTEKPFEILSRDIGCFGYALAQCVKTNIKAINAIAKYSRTTPLAEAVQACKSEGVQYVHVAESWANRSRKRLSDAISNYRIGLSKAFVALYKDHAVAIKPKSLTVHTAVGKKTFTWRTLHVNGLTVYDGL